jgi:hypothetical protein
LGEASVKKFRKGDVMKKLESLVKKALEAKAAKGIEGWNIQCPDAVSDLFDTVETGFSGCTSDTCRCVSHDPGAPEYKLVPREGVRLSELGYEPDNNGDSSTYFHVEKDGEEWFLELRESRAYHSHVVQVDGECIPEYIFSDFVEQGVPA